MLRLPSGRLTWRWWLLVGAAAVLAAAGLHPGDPLRLLVVPSVIALAAALVPERRSVRAPAEAVPRATPHALHDGSAAGGAADRPRWGSEPAERATGGRQSADAEPRAGAQDPIVLSRGPFLDIVGDRIGRDDDAPPQVVLLIIGLSEGPRRGTALGPGVVGECLRRARRLLGAEDVLGRLRQNELAVLPGCSDVAQAEKTADRLLAALRHPIATGAGPVRLRPSIGVASMRPGGVRELLHQADVAMYVAKGRRHGRVETFHPAMRAAALDRLELQTDLNRAVAAHELTMLYQLITEVANGQIVGVEALVRWPHPTHGPTSLATLLPLDGESGLVGEVTRFVLAGACTQVAAWQVAVPGRRGLAVLVNLARPQLEHPSLISDLAAALSHSGLDPRLLILEVTDSVLLAEVPAVAHRLQALRDLGVHLSIDASAASEASAALVGGLRMNVLKTDPTFLQRVADGDDAAAAVLQLFRARSLVTVGVGVESGEAGRQQERRHGRPQAGPMNADRMGALLSQGEPDSVAGGPASMRR